MESSTDRARSVFGNEQDDATYQKAVQSKERYLRRFGDDSKAVCHLSAAPTPVIGDMLGVRNLVISPDGTPLDIYADATQAPKPPRHRPHRGRRKRLAGHSGKHPHGLWALPYLDGHGIGSACHGLHALLA